MKKFRYKGNDATIGRFGFVERGATLTLTEEEAYYVRGNPNYVSVREAVSDDFPSDVLPVRGGHYDLTKLSWKTPRVFREVSRLRKARLMAVLSQMEAIGIPVPHLPRSCMDVAYLRDTVLTLARHVGWML